MRSSERKTCAGPRKPWVAWSGPSPSRMFWRRSLAASALANDRPLQPRGAFRPLARRSAHLDILPKADPVRDRAQRGLRRLIGPRRAFARGALLHQIVELHAVRALKIAGRFWRQPEQIHAHRLRREINVAADRARRIAVGDRLTLPSGLHLKNLSHIPKQAETGQNWSPCQATFHVKQGCGGRP